MVGWHDTPWMWMWLSMLVFWALVIALAYFAFRGRGSLGAEPSQPSAVDILKQRLARGEISSEDYHERLAMIQGTSAPKGRT